MKIAFVCLGNVCRSPMAELIFKNMAAQCGLDLYVSSFGTSDEEEGNGIYPLASAELARHGIYGSHTARQITVADVAANDYILAMDTSNIRALLRITGGKYEDRIFRLCDFTDNPRDVADPWYTRDFSTAYEDIVSGCAGFLEHIRRSYGDNTDR